VSGTERQCKGGQERTDAHFFSTLNQKSSLAASAVSIGPIR
jgi:hypothetical protein